MSTNVRTETETEVECLDASPDSGHPTYSRRLRTHMEEFRKFARWNSSLLYIMGFMIVLVLCSALAYFFIYSRSAQEESQEYQYSLSSYTDSTTEKIDPKMTIITLYSPETNENLCSTEATENIFLKLVATNNSASWEDWEFKCQRSVQYLSLRGPISSGSILHLDKLFGDSVTKIIVEGHEICSSTYSLDPGARIFKRISALEIFNTTEKCDKLLNGFLEDVPKSLRVVEFHSVVVSQKLENYIIKLVSSKQISDMQLQDLRYNKNASGS